MSKQLAIAVPILKGKTEQWKKFTNDLKTRYSKEYNESRKKLGVQERVFLQTTPQGDFTLITLEGKDPQNAFQQFGKGTDEFTKWFLGQVKEIHGLDLTQKFTSFPEMVVETKSVVEYA